MFDDGDMIADLYSSSEKKVQDSIKIKEMVLREGADVCGIASIDRFSDAPEGFSPVDVWKDCKSVISIGIALPRGLMKASSRLIYGHFNADICNVVDRVACSCAKSLEREYGALAMPIPCDGPYDYWRADTMTGKGILSMKHVAVACGIGTIGKSTLLLNPQYGNMLTVGAVLTDLELQSDPYCEDICIPGCNKCISECPVHAIRNGSVDQKLCRTNTYGKTERGFDTVECNKCRVVCPMQFGKR